MGNPLLERKGEIEQFIARISTMMNDQQLDRECHEFLHSFPPQYGLELATIIAWKNPFFMPRVPAPQATQLTLSTDQFSELVLRARLTAHQSDELYVLVACAPKSASTFLQSKLREATDLRAAMIFAFGANPSALGANIREQEIDELALLRATLQAKGFVAQHHLRASPFTMRLLSLYKLRPIVTHRNIFDTLISLDDMLIHWRADDPENSGHFFNDAMPANYSRMPREDRLTLLAHRWSMWLLQFYVSWKKCEDMGLVSPLWVSYEEDILGDKRQLAGRIAAYLGRDKIDVVRLKKALENTSDAASLRLNKGVAGRGEELPEAARQVVLSAARLYAGDMDLSPLVGEI
ncbi:hypothetical protein [Pseudohoeflea coraliihabitans]|uniref:Sulfotransferase family protein n=1 Tax=Pseudohoeflea coraliihabitans TaxID=2860393 RepID=A0ABS6WJ01_9HYPH|nr:hypothetical protein [Pseudohoeflea sp. DP4N28-3]MBW3095918.1 hypothetical protein [Pseudohoeflea sp. DP4N28-3]